MGLCWLMSWSIPSRNSHCKHMIWSPPTQEVHMVSVFASKDLATGCLEHKTEKQWLRHTVWHQWGPSQEKVGNPPGQAISLYQLDYTTEKLNQSMVPWGSLSCLFIAVWSSREDWHKMPLCSPAQVGCMRQALGPGALGRPRGSGWRGRWEGGSGWGAHVNPWLIHFNVWQNPLQ